MAQFTYSFCLAILHSFWQAALLLLLYGIINNLLFRNNAPLVKRNFLYTAITVQLLLSVLTFSLYFYEATGSGNLTEITETFAGFISTPFFQSITPWIFGLYLFIIVFKFVNAVYSWQLFKRQYKTGLQRPSADLKLFTELKAYQFGIKRKVKLWLSHSIRTPVTFGFFKPVILLPVALINNISTKQAETLILHELTHIRTNDYLLNWFLLTAETIFFFNPFLISLCKKVRLEREKNCDINVLSFAYSPALYAETLLQAERIKQRVPIFQLAAVDGKNHLLQRIRFFTNKKNIDQVFRFNIITPVIGILLLLMLTAAVLFQSEKIAFPIHAAADIQFIPPDNHFIADADYGKYINTGNEPEISNHKFDETQQPVINNEVKKSSPTVSKPKPVIIEQQEEPIELNFIHPVTTTENDAARQIIITEEGSGSSTVKVYYLSFEDGQWILKPEWILTAKEIMLDSLKLRIDSLQNRIRKTFPARQ